METFNFPYHTQSTEYPESGTRVQLGGSYVFTSPPAGPDLRRFRLSFPTMVYYTGVGHTDAVPVLDLTKNPKLNMAVLEKFYRDHKLHKSFIYPHPVLGAIECKFYSPLKIPEGVVGGGGALKDFTVELYEINQ